MLAILFFFLLVIMLLCECITPRTGPCEAIDAHTKMGWCGTEENSSPHQCKLRLSGLALSIHSLHSHGRHTVASFCQEKYHTHTCEEIAWSVTDKVWQYALIIGTHIINRHPLTTYTSYSDPKCERDRWVLKLDLWSLLSNTYLIMLLRFCLWIYCEGESSWD